MTKRQNIRLAQLSEAEYEFHVLLPRCLRECATGRWGLFGQNDHLDPQQRYLPWPKARQLRALALEIHSARMEFGDPDSSCEEFLRLCSLRGANVPGEPALAATLIQQVESMREPRKTAAPEGAAASKH
jgi:hypothetical protein